jgi:hypothetical protein
MNKKAIFFLLIAVVFCSWSMSQEIYLSRDGQSTDVKLLQDNLKSRAESALVLECHVQTLTVETVETEAGTFTKLSIPGWQYTINPGDPQLPMLSRIVEVPLGGNIQLSVLSSKAVEATAQDYGIRHPIFPHQPSRRRDEVDVKFVHNRAAYSEGFSKAPIATVEELGMMRSARLALVNFLPVQYSPVDGKLVLHNDIKVELKVEKADMAATAAMKAKYATKSFAFVADRALTAPSLRSEVKNKETYLIVADAMFEGNAKLQQFVEYKKGLGHPVVVKYFDGATIDEVQAYVKKQYAEIAPTFLLIVGDHEQIPGKSCGRHYSDLYYHSTLVGGDTDYLPDMLCGRFSASNAADLEAQIAKTLEYQQKKFADPAYLNRYCLVAGWDGSWAVKRGYPQIRYAIENYFNEDHGYLKPINDAVSDRNVFLSTGSHQNESAIWGVVNSGVGFYNYTAHGNETTFADPQFTRNDIDRLTNKGMYPLVVGNCCLTGSFQVDTCFGEKWLRAKDKGAIGYIGGSNYTYWDEDLWFGVGYCNVTTSINNGNAPKKADTGVGMYEAAFGEFEKATEIPAAFHVKCNAAVMYAGNMAVMASSSSRKEYYWQVYHLFGDPGLPTAWAHK